MPHPAQRKNRWTSTSKARNPDEQKWLRLAPPTGAGVFLLLVADEPAKDLPACGEHRGHLAVHRSSSHR